MHIFVDFSFRFSKRISFCFDCCWCQEIRSYKRSLERWKIGLKAGPALMPQPDMSNVGRLIINQHCGTKPNQSPPKCGGFGPLGEIRKARGWYWWCCMRAAKFLLSNTQMPSAPLWGDPCYCKNNGNLGPVQVGSAKNGYFRIGTLSNSIIDE